MKKFLKKKSEFKFDEYVQKLFFGVVFATFIMGLYATFLASLGIKDVVLSAMALIMNALLCAMQFYILFKIFELESDHVNHYDVEAATRNLMLPEQIIQIFLATIHGLNSAWWHMMIQIPLVCWHIYCIAAQRSPVKAVIGRSEEFAKSLAKVRTTGLMKGGFYAFTLIWCFFRVYAFFMPQRDELRWSPTGGWRLELFNVPAGMSSTPTVFSNVSLFAFSERVDLVDMDSSASNWHAFPRQAGLQFIGGGVRLMPDTPFAWRFVGKIRITRSGDYTFCTESDDGSLFYLDLNPVDSPEALEGLSYTLVIDNDGLHSSSQRCATIFLKPGGYHAKVSGFEGGGGLVMRLRYRGSDTEGQFALVRSYDPTPPPGHSDAHDGWFLQIFSIPHGTTTTPRSLEGHTLIGENRQLAAVKLDADRPCHVLVPGCPDDWFAWRFSGRIEVHLPGDYELCTESDDGSLVYVDKRPSPAPRDPKELEWNLVVDNDGLHGPQQRCAHVPLRNGRYHIQVVGFEGGGTPLMVLKHRGPDTGGQLVWTRSIDAFKP